MRQFVVTIIIFTVIFVAAFSVKLLGRENQNTSHSAVVPSNRVARGIAGLLLAFPAIFPASATLIEKHEKQERKKKMV